MSGVIIHQLRVRGRSFRTGRARRVGADDGLVKSHSVTCAALSVLSVLPADGMCRGVCCSRGSGEVGMEGACVP
jgi:hypothetical protein